MTDLKCKLLNDLEDTITEYLGEDYENNSTGELLIYKYRDGYNGEKITLEVERAYTNGKGWILIDSLQWDTQDEYFNLAALAQHGADFNEEEAEQYQTYEDEDDKKLATWDHQTDRYKHEGSLFHIEVYPFVQSETCYVNMTHLHHYRALGIKAKVYGIEQVKAFLEMRDLFHNLGWKILEENTPT